MNTMKVHMSDREITVEPFPQDKLLGGRAMVAYLMTEHVSPSVHPLSGENIFIVAPGLLAGTSAPSSGRLSIGGKSPLTGGIKEANVGGTVGNKLGKLGIQAIMVEGRAQDWQVLKIDGQGDVATGKGL